MACVGDVASEPVAASSDASASDAPLGQTDADIPDASLPEPELPCKADDAPGDGVYVSPDGDDATGSGTALLPFKTITAGLTAAVAAQKSNVYLAEGTYPEPLTFDGSRQGVFVRGGFLRTGESWRRDCAPGFRSRTILASPTSVGVRVTGVTKPTGLDAMTVATRGSGVSSNDTAGESCFGVVVTGDGSVFKLSRVKVLAGAGGKGGGAISPGAAATSACDGRNGCSAAPPRQGKNGDGAKAPTEQGTFTAKGFVGVDGKAGGPGTEGDNGTAGLQGSAMTCAIPGQGQCQSGGDQCVHTAGAAGYAPSGTCGCGGLAGAAGGPGRSGGASVALLVSGAGTIVSIDDSALVTTGGGDGSPGGTGGPGGAPSDGAPGPAKSCPQDNGPSKPPGPECGCVGMSDRSFSGGAKGGAGMPGGAGGAGSGGVGGDSVIVVAIGGARALRTGDHGQLQRGPEGRGAGGAPNGRSIDELTLP